jgi:hypothetical protein
MIMKCAGFKFRTTLANQNTRKRLSFYLITRILLIGVAEIHALKTSRPEENKFMRVTGIVKQSSTFRLREVGPYHRNSISEKRSSLRQGR